MTDCCKPNGDSVSFRWSAKKIGFGEFRFYVDGDKALHCENESMSKDFIKKLLCCMVDNAVMDEPNPKDEEDGV